MDGASPPETGEGREDVGGPLIGAGGGGGGGGGGVGEAISPEGAEGVDDDAGGGRDVSVSGASRGGAGREDTVCLVGGLVGCGGGTPFCWDGRGGGAGGPGGLAGCPDAVRGGGAVLGTVRGGGGGWER